MRKRLLRLIISSLVGLVVALPSSFSLPAQAATTATANTSAIATDVATSRIKLFKAKPPIHIYKRGGSKPVGLVPAQVKAVYGLPSAGGSGTIAIVAAFDSPRVEADLNKFSAAFGLPACTAANGCFEKHQMASKMKTDSAWAVETALDTQWAHAIAPRAKILLVEAVSGTGENLLAAVDYARSRTDVVSVSMSWGGQEFLGETDLDGHFTSATGAVFFASSGDSGTGTNWPAASPNVVAVGGTKLTFGKDGSLLYETAWSGSGGGVSLYERQPGFQKDFGVQRANGHRSVPDVAYSADPTTGFSVYVSTSATAGGWYVVGGTSAGAPQWAAIRALGHTAANERFYVDKASAANSDYFHDIVSGTNGDCEYYCKARRRYDYVTGLGSPMTANF